jgi:hypothetical protein
MIDPLSSPERADLGRMLRAHAAEVITSGDGDFPWQRWRGLAELGVLGIGSTEGGTALDVFVALEALGSELFPGPLIDTIFAAQVLAGDDLAALTSGRRIAAVVSQPYSPWPDVADWLLEIDADRVAFRRVTEPGRTVTTLTREAWSVADTDVTATAPLLAQARVYADIAAAAYLGGAARSCLERACQHARTRTQFGRLLGEFQAVSHALARCDAALATARCLVVDSAAEWDAGTGRAARITIAASAVARAAVDATLTSHQVFGAIGFSEEARIWRASTTVRQCSLVWLPPARVEAAARAEAHNLLGAGRAHRRIDLSSPHTSLITTPALDLEGRP